MLVSEIVHVRSSCKFEEIPLHCYPTGVISTRSGGVIFTYSPLLMVVENCRVKLYAVVTLFAELSLWMPTLVKSLAW